jgi:MFS family permease
MRRILRGLPRPVWLLGWTSLFTDAATETMYPLLPVYLANVLGAGPMALGVIEGVAEGVNSALKLVSGRLSDRGGRRKTITLAGYTLSSIAKPFIAVTTAWQQVLAIRTIDRMGKGIRGAPRDAMLAHFATPETRGRIFGFHQAMDHLGAVIGPLFATVFLLALPGRYRLLFALTAIPGALAVTTVVRVPTEQTEGEAQSATGVPSATTSAALSWRFHALMAILVIFSLGNSADAFLLLRLSASLGNDAFLPLLWGLLHVVKAALSVYGGALSDRIGRKAIIVGGWTAYAMVYLGFALVRSPQGLVACFLAYGIYFGLAEGTEKALVTDMAPASMRGTAFGYYNAALGIGALIASVLFGAIYERIGAATAFGVGAALAALATVLLAFLRIGPRPQATPERTL